MCGSVATASAAATTTTATVAAATTAAAATVATFTTAATTVTTAATTTATTATGAVFAGFGFVDGKRTAVVFLTVEGCDRRLGFFIRTHLDESESLASTGFPITDDFCTLHGAVLREKLFQFRAGRIVAQIPDIQLAAHEVSYRGPINPCFTFRV
jgi:hypothetical protein